MGSNFNPNAKKRLSAKAIRRFLAEDEGFEPPQTESESGVLPLHKSSICLARILLYAFRFKSQEYFSKNSKYFRHQQFAHSCRIYSSSQGKGAPLSSFVFM